MRERERLEREREIGEKERDWRERDMRERERSTILIVTQSLFFTKMSMLTHC